MTLLPLYRASMYVMLTLATLVLSINAEVYNRFAMLYPLAVALAGVGAFVTVDRRAAQGLARDVANLLAVGSFLVAMLEFWGEAERLPLALGHWLVYLSLIKMFLPKTVEDDWFLFLIGLVQVVIGVFLSQSTEVGGLLAAWAMTALWTLGLFHLHREALRNEPEEGVTVRPAPRPEDPYPGFLNPPFVVATLAVALTTLALGGLVFLFIPRWSAASTSPGTTKVASNLTGFTEEVELGRIGEILENETVVMTVELLDEDGDHLRPEGEELWRGLTLTRYEQGRWTRTAGDPIDFDRVQFPPPPIGGRIRQRYQVEPTRTDVLFALRPFYRAEARGGAILFQQSDGTLRRPHEDEFLDPQRSGNLASVFRYEVLSVRGGDVQPAEVFPLGQVRRRDSPFGFRLPAWRPDRPWEQAVSPGLLQVPDEVRRRLGEVADGILGRKDDDDMQGRARKLESYFRDSGAFFYSLKMTRVDPALDPVVDFVINRREGHCEYFASALALMLRTQGIPSRVVNGFKGGDYDEIFGALTVREKHAHSWVEALVGVTRGGAPIWITLDPTPALEREKVVAKVGGVTNGLRSLSDSFRNFWVFSVADFDQERQERLIYGPLRDLAHESGRGFRMIYANLQIAARWLFHFERPREFFSVRGFVVSVVVMLLAVGVSLAVRWLARRLLGRFGRGAGPDSALASGLAVYQRLMRLLAEAGLERPAGETPREFARRAASLLSARLDGAPGLPELPTAVVEAFYRVRFGHHALEPAAVRDLDARLDALAARLRVGAG
jgi:transglutaminase-like putative cysteine protease